MKLNLVVKYEDGHQEEVTARFADFVAFERTWSRSIAQFEHQLRLTDLAWIAWSALTRAKKTALKFDPDWIETISEVQTAETEADLPLEQTQQSGS